MVYRAYDRSLNRTVAIKTLPKVSPRHSARLKREARTIASISHPNLEAIFAMESWRGTPMLVLEYIPGGTLEELLEKGPIGIERAIELGAALTEVIDTLHRRGIVHRDIKPANVGFGEGGEPKLMDFGLARMMDATRLRGARPGTATTGSDPLDRPRSSDLGTTVTLNGTIVGTLLYMSPDALRGLPADGSRDLWSLAIMLFEAITGVNPANADTVDETFDRILAGDLPALADILPDAPRALTELFADSFSLDRRRRPRSGRQFQQRFAQAGLSSVTES